MLTGAEYLESLRDNRVNYIAGRQVTDLEQEPLLSRAVDWVARVYDRYYSPEPGAVNPLIEPIRSREALREHARLIADADLTVDVTFQSLMTLLTVVPEVNRLFP